LPESIFFFCFRTALIKYILPWLMQNADKSGGTYLGKKIVGLEILKHWNGAWRAMAYIIWLITHTVQYMLIHRKDDSWRHDLTIHSLLMFSQQACFQLIFVSKLLSNGKSMIKIRGTLQFSLTLWTQYEWVCIHIPKCSFALAHASSLTLFPGPRSANFRSITRVLFQWP